MPLEEASTSGLAWLSGIAPGFLVAWNMVAQQHRASLSDRTGHNYVHCFTLSDQAASDCIQSAAHRCVLHLPDRGMMLVARLGLSVGKWVSNAGAIFTLLVLGV